MSTIGTEVSYIHTIKELIDNLNNSSPRNYAKILKKIRIDESNLKLYMTWDNQCYTRNCLVRTDNYELILLCWDIGAQTPVHGHGGEDCWVYQVKGTIEEIRYEQDGGQLKEINRMTVSPKKLTYMHDRMGFHSLKNISNERAMTLHIYASPIDECQVYNDDDDCFEIKEMKYHTFKGKTLETIVK